MVPVLQRTLNSPPLLVQWALSICSGDLWAFKSEILGLCLGIEVLILARFCWSDLGRLFEEPGALVRQLGGRETIWASSRMRNRPGQTFDVHTIGAPAQYWSEVIRPSDPHKGQASTATKIGANDSR